MYASFIPRRTPLTLAQAMSRIDRANFVLKMSQAYDDSPQYVESFLCPVSRRPDVHSDQSAMVQLYPHLTWYVRSLVL